jgi:hypothetical protein
MSDKPHRIHFKIDKESHEITEDQNPVTGQYLRGLPPAVGEEYDLWLRARGREDDTLIRPDMKVTVRDGDHFYTAKRDITPGS